MSPSLEFKGYALTDPSLWSDLKVTAFKPKTFQPEDVEIAITHCGVCGSDVHTLTQGWGESNLPLVVGHEIIGKVTRVGDKVTEFKPGDRVGVGAQIGSCLQCKQCKSDYENYCPDSIDTYNGEYPDGVITHGGYSTAIRAHERFVFPIPDGIESRHAATMLCAGLTVYSPLKTYGAGPGKKIGVVGIGGLGHYAVLWAKAMGAEVYAFTHDKTKIEDIKKMGADHIINTEETDFHKPLALTLDLIISTRDVYSPDTPLSAYLSMLFVHGKFITVGIPDASDPLPQLHPFDFGNGCLLGGSHVGSKKECLEMLELARSKNVRPWIEEMPMRDVKKALEGVKHNKVRYRYVLTQDIN
ncbi:NADP-dependent alcohol dehydrogenase 6 [Sparassis crispa]|uniref:NADP-dependent alcohol dehydrogenase 6 n=1 Tax=Sparassis crispa TaxID=139825 RepID=A0A401GHC4_9APHY|nr:NADP-dependent alcohol dehydrogenase 6 [Sparassis crispa]GBE81580.1 NADP-dependent alcohol dehydrogenase 6 [Sparassis crispa]